MGNGISRTYPAGILKPATKQVRFGKPEVRQYCQDSWETTPLLNTHETRRIEAKIRAAPMAPMPKPKITDLPNKKIIKRPCTKLAAVMIAVGTFTTILACVTGGPIGLLVPVAFFFAFAVIQRVANRKAVTAAYKQEQLETAKYLDKLAAKNERAGLTVRAQVYRDMATKCRK